MQLVSSLGLARLSFDESRYCRIVRKRFALFKTDRADFRVALTTERSVIESPSSRWSEASWDLLAEPVRDDAEVPGCLAPSGGTTT